MATVLQIAYTRVHREIEASTIPLPIAPAARR